MRFALIRWLLRHITHEHHLDLYMLRYWIFFKRRKHGINFRLHNILRSDNDRHQHNHPWFFISIILTGGYTEEWTERHADYDLERTEWHGPGSILFRKANHFHRVLMPEKETWTFVITFGKKQEWGFRTEKGFIGWREYLVMTGQTHLIEDEDLNG